MANKKSSIFSGEIMQYTMASIYMLVISLGIITIYYVAWENLVYVPIPEPINLSWFSYQALAFAMLNGVIHFGFRKTKLLNSFEYLKWLVVLLIANTIFCYISMNIQRMPSLNEIQRLYGDGGVPDILFGLSIPISLTSAILGIWGIPYFMQYNGGKQEEKSANKNYQSILLKLVRSYAIVVVIILAVNLIYYQIYTALDGPMPQKKFPISDLIQMTIVLTAIAAMMFLYLRDNAEKGFFMYILLTFIISFSAFMAGLSRVSGQPVFDETLWLNLPLSLFSMIGELVGIPYFFKNSKNGGNEDESIIAS